MKKNKAIEDIKAVKGKISIKAIAAIVLAVVIVILTGLSLYSLATPPIKTQTAALAQYKDTVTAKMFAVREEKYVTAQPTGVPVSIVEDGERVAKEQPIAAYLEDEAKAKKYIELKNHESELLRYQNLVAQEHNMSTNIKISKVNSEADKAFSDAVNVVNGSDLRNIDEYLNAFNERITTKQILLNGNIDFSKQVEDLKSKVQSLKLQVGKINYVSAHDTGYYSSFADGYEYSIKPSQLQNLKCSDIKKLLKSKPDKVPTNNMGKIISGYNWYFVGVLSKSDALKLDLNQHIKIQCENASRGYIDAVVDFKGKPEKDGIPVVLKSDIMDSDISRLRIEDVQIVLNETEGLRVSKQAARVVKIVNGTKEVTVTDDETKQEKKELVEVTKVIGNEENPADIEELKNVTVKSVTEGVHGVYVLKRNTVEFRLLDTIYTGSDYLVSQYSADKQKDENGIPYLNLYDEIIVEGKDLEDGKVIKK